MIYHGVTNHASRDGSTSLYLCYDASNTRRAPELEAGDEKPKASGGEGKVEEDDVKLVVAQTGCTEEKAREALREEKGDLINASESNVIPCFPRLSRIVLMKL